ncbi:SWI/SNF chromatin remodeling complex component [Viridothelium virens]|uniref:SWI/SNF chromatin remodeling complex component n=1 Tax=Viridothelium virens TaxID=1048519 RepID=A0A6A6GZ44_VIRVR|nr:SWI/SNF chromatin remodeling complex component [Viridothelium virens]
MMEASNAEEAKRAERLEKERKKDLEGGTQEVDKKYKALEHLLSQSKVYAAFMLEQIQKQEEKENAADEKTRKREEKAEQAAEESQRRTTRRSVAQEKESSEETDRRGRGRPKKAASNKSNPRKDGKISDWIKKEDVEAKAGKGSLSDALKEEEKVQTSDIGVQQLRSARQPKPVTGGIMRSYQLEGLEWLISLYENGLNGILADEMGLGKTIQTIAFLAFLREKRSFGPFLIAAPLSTTSNWVDEFHRWTPDIPVVLYHGSKQERTEIREKQLKNPGSEHFPVVCTSYEICMNDRKFLAGFGWKFIIIDEGHRIKNLNCRLIRELQSYRSANRLLITGTPLQNNLTELWSLLHFLMPDIFDKLESFESWFDFSALKERHGYEQILSEERRRSLVSSLHAILKPFLLRRVKADVEHSLPKKREYILYAPLSKSQQELYQAILDGNSRDYLENKAIEHLSGTATPNSTRSGSGLKRKAASGISTPAKSTKTSRDSTPASTNKASGRGRKAKKSQNYEELSDAQFFKKLENNEFNEDENDGSPGSSDPEFERASTLALAKRQIASKKLQNPILQLRLCCNSPHNFYYPFDATTDADPDDTLITESGKMQLLDRLLPALFADGHKVLLFSQFKTQLDLVEDYATLLRGWSICRIDGGVAPADRQEQIRAFNAPAFAPKKGKNATPQTKSPQLFLLSTRAGGQGINLAAADTVILFDSDWNPQQDLQAQDRAHRIGQTQPVIVYRLATRGTVEEVLLERADQKRRLEKLVIRKGRFRAKEGQKEGEEWEELQRVLRRGDGEVWEGAAGEREGVEGDAKEVLSEEDLKVLMDRSEEAFERAEKGLDRGGEGVFKAVETKREGGGLLEGMGG